MIKIVIVNKKGTVSSKDVRSLKLDDLYKKCNFRKKDNFKKRATWKHKDFWVSVYAKDVGRSDTINKYELPPPVDKIIYYGSIAIIKHTKEEIADNVIKSITDAEWKVVYEALFGGFEDLDSNEAMSEEEDIPDELKTKEGYLKDGFVVEDDEDDDDEDYVCPSEEDESEENESGEEDEDEDNYGGETEEEIEEEEDNEDEDEEEGDDGDPASELSEEEYEYE